MPTSSSTSIRWKAHRPTLIFFSEHDPDQPDNRLASITHVAISLGGDEVIHATSGCRWRCSEQPGSE
jgi:hypothetical protein